MITCFKCDAPVVQEPDNTLRKTCSCDAPLRMTPVSTGSLAPAPSDVPYAKPCPDCRELVFLHVNHYCRGTMSQEEKDPRDYAQQSHLDTMERHMKDHELECVSCSYLKQCGFKTRCVEYRNMKEIYVFWEKRVRA